jgi:hypothetical protein
MQVPADLLVSPRVDAQAGRRKDELPAEVAAGAGRFAVERFGQRHGAEAAGQIALVLGMNTATEDAAASSPATERG